MMGGMRVMTGRVTMSGVEVTGVGVAMPMASSGVRAITVAVAAVRQPANSHYPKPYRTCRERDEIEIHPGEIRHRATV